MTTADNATSLRRLIPTLLLAALLAACNGDDAANTSVASASEDRAAAITLAGQPATEVNAGDAYSYQPVVSDGEPQTVVTYSISGQPGWSKFDSGSGTLSGTPTSSDVGSTEEITITATSSQKSGSVGPFKIRVRNRSSSGTNVAPTITGSPSTAVTVAQNYSFQPSASDSNADPLTFSIVNRPSWATFSTSDGKLTGSPSATDVGTFANIVISVSDGTASASLPAFAVQVMASNRAPTIAGSPQPGGIVGQAYSFVPTTSDADGDPLTFSIENRPSWASFDTATGALTGTPSQAATHSDIRISVSDGKVSANLASFAIAVTSAPVSNRAPTIAGTPPATVASGSGYSFQPTASDADGNALTFSVQNKPGWANFSTSTGRLSGTPSSANVGTYGNIVIAVSDGSTSASLPAFALQVTQSNRAPTISGTPATSVTAGQAYSFTPVAADADGNMLGFTITNKPSWATFNTSTGKLTGTPATTQTGAYSGIVIAVSDGVASTSLAAFSISVVAPAVVNNAPTIAGTPSPSVVVGASYNFTPIASDADGNALTFAIQNKPSWAGFNSSTGQLTGTPTAGAVGTYSNIIISVSDGVATTSLGAFAVTVTQGANGSATLSWSAPTQNTDGSALTNLAGYRIYYGTNANSMSQTVEISTIGITNYQLTGLAAGTWYFAIKAFNSAGVESDLSNTASKTIS